MADFFSIARKHKMRKDDAVCIPRSLFDRPSATILKMRRDVKMQKMGGSAKPSSSPGYKPPAVVNKPIIDTHQDSPEWLIHEDWALLQVNCSLMLGLSEVIWVLILEGCYISGSTNSFGFASDLDSRISWPHTQLGSGG